eukprot:TRINITY_DN1560_c0_g1_i2.p1 TRINITY_DN1560_c0_g1~~TRINITY_DN1560_c0_g1_i2.p1  ORF type:complete len:156 (+),score=15.71 TRINITY_DN1560_c0_g1_i2:181-648(+)
MNIIVRQPSGESIAWEVEPFHKAIDLMDGAGLSADVELIFEGNVVPTSELLVNLGICEGAEFEIGLTERGLARQYIRQHRIPPTSASLNNLIVNNDFDSFKMAVLSELFPKQCPMSIISAPMRFARFFYDNVGMKHWSEGARRKFLTRLSDQWGR